VSLPTLVVSIIGDASKLAGTLDDAGNKVEGFSSGVLGTAAKVAGFAAIAGGAAVAIGEMTQAAADDAQEQARLEQAIKASGAATGDWAADMDEAIRAGQALAFTDTQIRDAMVPLVGATGDVAEASELLATAQDLARLKGIDLTTASEAVAKAHEGNSTQLERMLGLSGQGLTATQALAEAQRLAAGQATTYADSTAGGLDRMSIMFDEVGETVGAAFLPALEEILPVLIPIIEQFGELVSDLLPVLIPLLKLAIIPLKLLAKAISAVLDFLGPLIDWLGDAIGLISDFVEGLGDVPVFGGGGGGGARSGATSFVTIHTGADAASVTRALRQYAGDNGGQLPTAIRAWG
jgi:hypothetical protein